MTSFSAIDASDLASIRTVLRAAAHTLRGSEAGRAMTGMRWCDEMLTGIPGSEGPHAMLKTALRHAIAGAHHYAAASIDQACERIDGLLELPQAA